MSSSRTSIPRQDAAKQSSTPLKTFAPLRLFVMLVLVTLGGCKEKKENTYPPDRLTVEYTIDRSTIMVGDPVELIVTAYYPTNGTLELPEIGREKEVVLLRRDWQQLPNDAGLSRSESRYSITSFRIGEHMLSTGEIRCTVGDRTYATNFPPVVLHVRTALPDGASSEIADIKPARRLPGRVPRWVWIVLGAAAVAFLTGLLTARVWKNREQLIPAPPPIPPHVIAMKALQSLKEKGLLEREECKAFYTELSLILRTYLEGRFHLNAPDETTEEIVEEMSRSPELNGTQRNILQDFMRQADMVKFAKGHPDRTTMEAAFITTEQFVEETREEQADPSDQPRQSER